MDWLDADRSNDEPIDAERLLKWAADVVHQHAMAWTGHVRECYLEVEKQIRQGPPGGGKKGA